jgi:hypothetical protein
MSFLFQARVLESTNDSRAIDVIPIPDHTLRFVERNLAAKAQKMALREFPQHNLGKVVEALMERCDKVVAHKRSIGERQSETQNARRSRGIGV